MKLLTNDRDPMEDLWADRAFVEAYLDVVAGEYERAHPDDAPVFVTPFDVPEAPTLFDQLVHAEDAARRARAAAAEQDDLFQRVLASAASDPTPWSGPDPADDPSWEPPEGWTRARVQARRRDLAVRAAAADIATRVHLSDNQVRGRAHRAHVLATRCPQTWQAYLQGWMPEQNAAYAAQLADTLPPDDYESWHAFDDAIATASTRLAPAKFRRRAAAARERAHRESIEERHARAAADRCVHFSPDLDGMATLVAELPAATIHAIEERLEDHARHLSRQPDEKRTLDQLRADVFGDLLLTGDLGADASPKVTTSVRLTIPALTLLGHSTEPATIDGYGPIDLETARRLAGNATSWIRVLTHPVTGTVLDVDRKAYRVPSDLRRLLGARHQTCPFPGCCRPSHRCDIDHRRRWADGGTTSVDNLSPLCERHHSLKDETLWSMSRDPATGELSWTSPTGVVSDVDPPPF